MTTRVCSDHILIEYLETKIYYTIFDIYVLSFRRWEHQLKIRGQESQVMKFFSRVNTSIALFLSEARLCGLLFIYFFFCYLCRKISILSKGTSYKSLAKVQSI